MATLTPVVADIDGVKPTPVACSGGGDSFVPDDRLILVFKNGHSSAQSVTV